MATSPCVAAENSVSGSPTKKKTQRKAPKRIHKAEREKLKRDHMNELFLELGLAIEPTRQNNCKASILGDATRLLQDLVARVEALKKENLALVTESRYVLMEKNELKDENTVLEAEIGKLHSELQERMQSDPVWSNHAAANLLSQPQSTSTAFPMQQQQQPSTAFSPLYANPLNQECQPGIERGATRAPHSLPPHLARPQARYPTPDSWPLQLLSSLPEAAQEVKQNSSSSSTITQCEGELRLTNDSETFLPSKNIYDQDGL